MRGRCLRPRTRPGRPCPERTIIVRCATTLTTITALSTILLPIASGATSVRRSASKAFGFFIATLLLATSPPTHAQQPSTQSVGATFNWYYATSFGTGVYNVGQTNVGVLALPLGYTLIEPDDSHWGLRLTVPMSVAFGNFDFYNPELRQIESIRLAAASVMPGFEVDIPLQPNWRLDTFANAGRAWETESGTAAKVYQAGMSTHYKILSLENPAVELGAKYIYAGYTANGADSTPVSLASMGIAASFPISWTLKDGHQTNIGVHWIGTSYLTDVRFQRPGITFTEIHGEQQFGLTLGLRPAVKFLGMSFDRIGLGYVVADNGLYGIRLVTDFPF
jgi:hypothetical protein